MDLGKNTLLLVILSLFFLSCDKHHAKKYAGVYTCEVYCSQQIITQSFYDTIYVDVIKIEQSGKYLNVLTREIHIDSLWKEKEYKEGSIHSFFSIKFVKDSVYITSGSSGLGGTGSCSYKGVKKD